MSALAISIVCHDNPALLARCLASIRADGGAPSLHLIVTDNTNSAAVQSVARRYLTPIDTLLVNAVPRGFAANHNVALRRSADDYVLLLNDDTVVLPGAVSTMVGCMERDPRVAAVGCKMYASDRRDDVQGTCFTRFPSALSLLQEGLIAYTGARRLWPRSPLVRAWRSLAASHDIAQAAAHLNGACLLLRTRSLDDVGVLDERFHMFREETDLCFRLRQAGWILWYSPEAAIIHYGRASTGSSIRGRHYAASTQFFMRKHYGRRGVLLYRLVTLLLWPLAVLADVTKAAIRWRYAWQRRRAPALRETTVERGHA